MIQLVQVYNISFIIIKWIYQSNITGREYPEFQTAGIRVT